MRKIKGWINYDNRQSKRHGLSALGIKTGRKSYRKKSALNILEGNPMFFPNSKLLAQTVKTGELGYLNYTATKLRMDGQQIDPAKLSQVAMDLEQKLKAKGYSVNVDTTGGKLTFKNIRLIPDVTGYNISPYTGKRGRVLNWDDWVKVNDTVNQAMDKESISANVRSLGGKFVIRTGTKAMTEDDWTALADDNVGSQVNPIARSEAWKRELGYPKGWKKTDIKTSPQSDSVFESGKGKILWIRKSDVYDGRWVVGGANRRGYIGNTHFKTKAEALKFAKSYMEKRPLGYTPKYKASDIGAVATDITVGTGAEIRKYAPVIAVAKVRQWTKKQLRERKKKAEKKRERKSGLFYSKSKLTDWTPVTNLESVVTTRRALGWKKKGKLLSIQPSVAKGGGWVVYYPLKKPMVFKTKPQALAFAKKYMRLHYPQAIKSKYPTVTKEITKLSLKHNLKKPILKYGKNKRLATFLPPNTIKLSKRLMLKGRAKRKDVAQHEFKHLIDTQRTNIRDVAELETRAIKFEKVTK